INILLPVLAPILLLFVAGRVCAPAGPYASKLRIIRATKDGQLGWIAVVFCANATYDLYRKAAEGDSLYWEGPILAACIVCLIISSLLAIMGATFPVPEAKFKKATWKEWILHYRLLVMSTFFTAFSALLATISHFSVQPACP
ncbi:hypothetical protein, partial [Pseudoduganella sp.]|uniref:hypothetical protein n=1 Tax=Pseudoduganella sp. TaxID=1880898 RepID=UPI0035B367FB